MLLVNKKLISKNFYKYVRFYNFNNFIIVESKKINNY